MVDARSRGALLLAVALMAPAARAGDGDRGPDLFPAHRYGYVAGGVLALTGAGFGFIARSEALRATTLSSARESSATMGLARDHAATANLCYAMAGASVLYALALEFLPRPAAETASLAFRF
jgi:hypothetical protein